jgi:hypothetical protein
MRGRKRQKVKKLSWINAELETATTQYQRAAAELNTAGFDPTSRDLSRYQRDYWSGYADALTNVLYADALTNVINELAGPGDVN